MENHPSTPEKYTLTYEVTIPEGEMMELNPPDGTVRSIKVLEGFGEIRVCDNYYIAVPGLVISQIYKVYCSASSEIGNLVLSITDENI